MSAEIVPIRPDLLLPTEILAGLSEDVSDVEAIAVVCKIKGRISVRWSAMEARDLALMALMLEKEAMQSLEPADA
jgi:tRNA A37 threonylcarbamoyladenosine synthetase subunit TsaC/SUA5/YrdC